MRIFIPLLLALSLSGCAVAAVGSAVVGGTVGVTKLAVKGTVGAGKLAYRGTKAVVRGTDRLVRGGSETVGEVPSSAAGPAPDISQDYDALPDADD